MRPDVAQVGVEQAVFSGVRGMYQHRAQRLLDAVEQTGWQLQRPVGRRDSGAHRADHVAAAAGQRPGLLPPR
jgi:hypothetical protein